MNEPETKEELEREKAKAGRETSLRIEREFLLNALGRNHWEIEMAARDVNMSTDEFMKLMKKYQINGR
jgi:transcriptional regulator with GAF, ATPase, and Fis domain